MFSSSLSSSGKTALIALCLFSVGANAEGYFLGAGLDWDSADGRAVSAFGDFNLVGETWLSLTAVAARTEGTIRDNDTVLADVGLEHMFGPFGIRAGAAYWGNADILDSRNLRASFYFSGETNSISVEFERRDFEFDLQSDLLRGRTTEFSANGLGLRIKLGLSKNMSVTFDGMSYDYSRNIRIEQDIDVLAFLSSSRLSMINSLIDHRVAAGLVYDFGLKTIDVEVGRWQTAVDGGTVDSYSLGFMTPISYRFDVEFRLSFDNSDTFGRTTAFSVNLVYFGGL